MNPVGDYDGFHLGGSRVCENWTDHGNNLNVKKIESPDGLGMGGSERENL